MNFSALKLDAINAVAFVKKLLAKLQGTPAIQHAEVSVLETAKEAIEAAADPFLGVFSPEANALLDQLFARLEADISTAKVLAPNPPVQPVGSGQQPPVPANQAPAQG